MTQVRVLGIGACLLHGPMSSAIRSGEMGRSTVARGGSTPGTYSFGEIFQLLDFLEGTFSIPQELRALCGYHEKYEPTRDATRLRGADVCLIEPNGTVEIQFEDYRLNRAQILRYVTNPIKTINRELATICSSWYNKGILAGNEEARRAAADKLIPHVEDGESAELVRRVLAEARGVRRDATKDLRTFCDRMRLPIGVMAYTNQYMPDGRPVFWPPEFGQEIAAAVTELSLPFLEPWRIVMEYGGAPALAADMRHYSDEFMPVIATRISRFAEEVFAESLVNS